jgi:hypothetical protein
MSAIDPTTPTDTDNLASASFYGSVDMRAERVWLNNLWQAYKVRHQDGSTPNDPGTTFGVFNIPFSTPGSPKAGDIWFTTTGIMNFIRGSLASRQCGTLESGVAKTFRQAAAPTGWTRDTGKTNKSILRLVATGTPGNGGTNEISVGLPHTGPSSGGIFVVLGASCYRSGSTDLPNHTVKYIDVLLATKN